MTQWAEVRHLHLVEDVPKKEIARRLKLDVKTGAAGHRPVDPAGEGDGVAVVRERAADSTSLTAAVSRWFDSQRSCRPVLRRLRSRTASRNARDARRASPCRTPRAAA